MTKRLIKTLGALALAMLIGVPSAVAGPDARAILDGVDDLYRSKTSHGKMSMTVKTAHWKRTLEIESWTAGKDNSLMRILSPKKEKGTTTLRVDQNIWNYLPKVKRVIKLPSSMMGGSWMGSHFTNDDLVKQSRMADDFNFEVTFEGQRGNKKIIEITCIPRENAAVVWGKIVVEVTAGDLLPLRTRYYDEDKKLARTMRFARMKKLGGRMMPTLMRIVPTDKPEEYTEVSYDELDLDITLDEDIFSLRSLKK